MIKTNGNRTFRYDKAGDRTDVTVASNSNSSSVRPTPSAIAGELLMSALTFNSATISWQPATGAPTSYEYTLDNGTQWNTVNNRLYVNVIAFGESGRIASSINLKGIFWSHTAARRNVTLLRH